MSAKAQWTTVGTIGWIVGMAYAGIASAQAPPALLPEPGGLPKNRFLSISFPQSPEGTQWAIRVTLVKLYNNDPADEENEACAERPSGCGPDGVCRLDRSTPCSFDSDCHPALFPFEGQVRWVGPAKSYPETSLSNDPVQWIGAALQCCPAFRDWATEMDVVCAPHCVQGFCLFIDNDPCSTDDECPAAICDTTVLHLFGAEIIPCSQYELRLVDLTCADLTDDSCYSDPLTIHTAKWGDLWPPLGGESQPNFTDINKMVEKFKGILPPIKVQVMLGGNIPAVGSGINFIQIGHAVHAFKRIWYYWDGPIACSAPCE